MKKQLLFFLLFIPFLQSYSQNLTADIVTTDESCDLGSIVITASNGNGNYVYAVVLEGELVGESDFSPNDFFNLPSGSYDVYVRDNSGQTGFSEFKETVIIDFNSVPEFSVSELMSPACTGDNGAVNVSVISGTPPYTISVYNSSTILQQTITTSGTNSVFSNLSANSYYITLEDASNCSMTLSITVNDPPPLVSSASLTQAYTCTSLGEITFQEATGGTPPYAYGINGVYSNELVKSNLTEGTYDLSVTDANGCEQYINPITIEELPTEPGLTYEVIYNCFGTTGDVTINTTGNTSNFFTLNGVTQISNVFTELATGNYTVTVNYGSNCTKDINITVEAGQIFSASITSKTDASCYGSNDGSITVTAFNYGDSFSYTYDGGETWFGSSINTATITNLPAGSSGVGLILNSSNGCEYMISSSSLVVESSPEIVSSASLTQAYSCASQGEITFQPATGGTPPYAYGINGVYSNELVKSNLTEGTYDLSVTDANGCEQYLNAIIIEPIIYPTLNLTSTNISCAGAENGEIEVDILEGVPPFQVSLYKSTTGVLTSLNETATNYTFINLSNDEFYIEVTDGNGCSTTSNPVIIDEPEQLTVNAIVNTTCSNENGGEIVLEGFGGTPPYEYSIDGGLIWQSSNTFSNITNGTYQISIIDANLCTTCSCFDLFENGSFEYATSLFNDGRYLIVDETSVPGWETTAPDNKLEIWQSGFLDIPAYEGSYFVELNANTSALDQALYQEFCTNEGDVIEWQVAHRGRSGTDVAEVRIGGSLATATMQQTMTTDNTNWVLYSGIYTVPAGQSSTTIMFEAISSSNGNLSVGNFLDAINVDITSTICTSFSIDVVNPPALSGIVNELEGFGNIEILATGGVPPYEYSIDGGTTYQTENQFLDLEEGAYIILIKDSNNCLVTTNEIEINAPVNNSPVAVDDYYTTIENVAVVIDPLLQDSDVDGDTLTIFSVNGISFTTPFSIALTGGTLTITTDNTLTFAPEIGFTGTVVFPYTISDGNGGLDTANIVIVVEDNATLDIVNTSVSNILCNGDSSGEIAVSVSGGISPFRYQLILDNGVSLIDVVSDQSNYTFTGLSFGEYQVKVTDNNFNTTSELVTVLEPNALLLSYEYVNPSCFGSTDGIIYLYASGGTGEYVYGLNSNPALLQTNYSFTNLTGGVYDVTVQDENGCFTNVSIVLEEPEPVIINSITVTASGNIASGTISLGATGGNGDYVYTIYLNGEEIAVEDVFYDLAPGEYEVIASDANGCNSTPFSVTITVVNVDNSVSEKSGGGFEANNKNATSYQWINVDTKTRIPGATNSFFIPSEYGRYQVEMTITGSAKVTGKNVSVLNDQIVLSPIINYTSGVLGLADTNLGSFTIYPNPVNNFITIPTNLLGNKFKVYDLLGKNISQGKIANETLNVMEYSNGIYFLKVEGYEAVKFIKN